MESGTAIEAGQQPCGAAQVRLGEWMGVVLLDHARALVQPDGLLRADRVLVAINDAFVTAFADERDGVRSSAVHSICSRLHTGARRLDGARSYRSIALSCCESFDRD